MKPNTSLAADFLSLFNYSLVTFQFLRKGKPAGHYVSAPNDIDWDYLTNEHSKGKEIFFMVNEGDGVTKEGKRIPRSQKNVTTLKSFFIDTDDCPISEVRAFLKANNLKPHIVVETSPKKYHLYFLLAPQESLERGHPHFHASLKKWKLVQHHLSHLGHSDPRTDSSVKDSSRVLRLPGFYHLKNPKAPHLTQVVQQYTHPLYSLDETLELFGHHTQSLESQDQECTAAFARTPYQLPDGKVGKGNRHHQITSLLGHVLNKELDPDLALRLAYSIIEEKFENPKEFLPNGPRNHEIHDFIAYKLQSIKEEKIEERKIAIDEIEEDDNSTSFELPDDFYFNAPGIAGEITKEITSTAYYPLPSFAWASAISLLSLLKGKSVHLEDGTAPNNYFLTLAPTGAGKNYAKEVIRHTLHSLNKSYLVESKVRSDRGVLQWLNRNDGVGLLFMDEAEELLRAMEGDKTGQHIRNFKTLLLELYSATNDPHLSFGEISSRKEDPIVLNSPHFSSIIMGTPNIMGSAFTKKSVTDGLFQRFNVIYTRQPRVPNPDSGVAAALNGQVYSQLNDIIRLTAIAVEDGGSIIKISKGAASLLEEATEYYDGLYNEELRKGTELEGIYTRAVEKAKRLAVAMCSTDELSEDLMGYCLEFIEKNTEAMRETAAESFIESQVSKDMRDLQKFVARRSGKDGMCRYRDILRGFRIRDSRQLKQLLQDCIEGELLEVHQIKSTSKGGRPGYAYSVKKV